MKHKKFACLLLAGALCLLCACGGGGGQSSSSAKNVSVGGSISDSGNAYIPQSDGSVIEISAGGSDITTASTTPDGEHIVVLQEDGTLYYTDKKQSEKHEVATDCEALRAIRDEGIFYLDSNGRAYRVLFKDGAVLELGLYSDSVVAADSLSILYITNGEVCTLPYDSTEKVSLGASLSDIELEGISNDGGLAVLMQEDSKTGTTTQKIYIAENGNLSKFEDVTVQSNYPYATVQFSADQKLVVVSHSDADCIWIKSGDSGFIKANLGATPASNFVYTANGYVSENNASNIKNLYAAVEGDNGNNLYSISLDGERELLVSGVSSFSIRNGNLFYIDSDKTLRYAKLDGANLGDSEKIASDVDSFKVSDNGSYVYYIRDFDGWLYSITGTGTLYAYKVGEQEPVKVSSDVYYNGYNTPCFSTDGGTLYYFKEASKAGNTYITQGTLMKWTYGAEDAEKIASEILTSSCTSHLYSGELDAKSLWFEKYVSVDSAGEVHTNLMYYNGSDTEKVVSDMIA